MIIFIKKTLQYLRHNVTKERFNTRTQYHSELLRLWNYLLFFSASVNEEVAKLKKEKGDIEKEIGKLRNDKDELQKQTNALKEEFAGAKKTVNVVSEMYVVQLVLRNHSFCS